MVKEIMKDPLFLAKVSKPSEAEDTETARDLLDTLLFHKDECVGMAANMIGVSKRIIAFDCEGKYMLMFDPEIIRKDLPYETEEGCLSLSGKRKVKRWKSVKIRYLDENRKVKIRTFTGFTAQIIQHEVDHLEGILI